MSLLSDQALNKSFFLLLMSSYKTAQHILKYRISFFKDFIKQFVLRYFIFFRCFITYFENLDLKKIYSESQDLSQLINKCLEVRMIKFNAISISICNQRHVLICLDNDTCRSCENQYSHVDIQFKSPLAFKFEKLIAMMATTKMVLH